MNSILGENCRGMETNFEKGTGAGPRRTIIVEDKNELKTSFEEEIQLYICKRIFKL